MRPDADAGLRRLPCAGTKWRGRGEQGVSVGGEGGDGGARVKGGRTTVRAVHLQLRDWCARRRVARACGQMQQHAGLQPADGRHRPGSARRGGIRARGERRAW